jgi:hypothetical protein
MQHYYKKQPNRRWRKQWLMKPQVDAAFAKGTLLLR